MAPKALGLEELNDKGVIEIIFVLRFSQNLEFREDDCSSTHQRGCICVFSQGLDMVNRVWAIALSTEMAMREAGECDKAGIVPTPFFHFILLPSGDWEAQVSVMEKESCIKRLKVVEGEFVEVNDEAEAADVVLSVKESADRGVGAQSAYANFPTCSIGDRDLHLRPVTDKGGYNLQIGVTDKFGNEDCCFYVKAASAEKKQEIVSLVIQTIEERFGG